MENSKYEGEDMLMKWILTKDDFGENELVLLREEKDWHNTIDVMPKFVGARNFNIKNTNITLLTFYLKSKKLFLHKFWLQGQDCETNVGWINEDYGMSYKMINIAIADYDQKTKKFVNKDYFNMWLSDLPQLPDGYKVEAECPDDLAHTWYDIVPIK